MSAINKPISLKPETIQPNITHSSRTFLLRYFIAFVCIILTALIAYSIASNNKHSTNDNYYIYLTAIIVPLLIASVVILPIFSEGFNFSVIVALITVFIVGLITIYYFMKIVANAETRYVSGIMYFLGILIAIVLLAMAYKIFYRIIRNVKGTWGFVLNMVFLIPCILLDGIEYIYSDFKNTETSVRILFLIELILVFLFSFINTRVLNRKSDVVLLSDPEDLYRLHKLSDDSVMYSSSQLFRENYGVSMWIYINTSHSTHGKPIPLFFHGNMDSNGDYSSEMASYPTVEYDQTTQKLKVLIAKNNSIQLDITGQKWNYLAISMDEGNANIFLNGELIKTLPYSTEQTGTPGKYNLYSGWNGKYIDGIFGAICNIIYHKLPLTPEQVSRTYNLFSGKNPPI